MQLPSMEIPRLITWMIFVTSLICLFVISNLYAYTVYKKCELAKLNISAQEIVCIIHKECE